jgi:hypothetical protein
MQNMAATGSPTRRKQPMSEINNASADLRLRLERVLLSNMKREHLRLTTLWHGRPAHVGCAGITSSQVDQHLLYVSRR